jgi:sugar phosphate permease
MTQYLQFVHGWTPLGAGVRLLPFAFTMMVVAPSSARIAERIGTKRTVALGLLIGCTGFVLASRLQVDSSYAYLIVVLMVMAGGMAMTMPPSTAAILSSMPMGKQGVGSAVNDTTRELGGALGVAVLGSVFATRYHSALGSVSQLPPAARQAVRASLGSAIAVSHQIGGSVGAALDSTAKHAFTTGMGTAFLVAAGVVLSAAFLIWRIMPMRLTYDYESIPEEAGPALADLGPLESAQGTDEAVDDGHDGRRGGKKAGAGAGSVGR